MKPQVRSGFIERFSHFEVDLSATDNQIPNVNLLNSVRPSENPVFISFSKHVNIHTDHDSHTSTLSNVVADAQS